jgi:hypothetical protein
MLLSMGSGLVDRLAALSSALCELLGLVLDLRVQALEDGDNGALELLCGLVVLVRDALPLLSRFSFSEDEWTYLGIGSDVLEHARNATQRLIEMMAFFQRVLDRLVLHQHSATCFPDHTHLQYSLVLLAVRMVGLLGRRDIIL